MAENIEQIEAKLAAYVDGELDAAGRAEIEAHLKANPQHRQLIDDLVAQRLMLRALPRASAPPEVMERMEAHLERSGLLDETPAQVADPSRRIQRWPQRLAVAAIVLLAVGLGGIVFYVIRPPGGVGITAINSKSLPGPSGERVVSQQQASPAGNGGEKVRENPQLSSPVPPAGGLAAVASPATTHPSAPAGGAGGERLLFVVATNDPIRANRQIASFLQANRIVTDSPMGPLEALKAPAFPHEAPAVQDTQTLNFQNPASAASPVERESGKSAGQAAREPVAGEAPREAASAVTTAPADRSAADGPREYAQRHSPSAANGEQATTDQARMRESALQAAPSATAPVAANREVYLVRDMTRAQLEALRRSLAEDESHPMVMVYDRPLTVSGTAAVALKDPARGQGGEADLSAAATTNPVRDALAPGAFAMTTAPSEQEAKALAAPASQPAERFEEAALPATSQPTDGALSGREAELKRASKPTTAPAAPFARREAAPEMGVAASSEEKRDVVILVLKAPAAVAGDSAAATQPALGQESAQEPATRPTSQPGGWPDPLAR